ncbi:HD domain-containing protein [Paenibacillus sp. RC67]|uniref:HD domain-containing protein n=1 Tax=Paenibacillus sp. RC67 TaxID=3039392 RepID=UPI0032C21639
MTEILNEDLRLWNIPSTRTNELWQKWRDFALTFDGYDYFKGDSDGLFKLHSSVAEFFKTNKSLPSELSLSELRVCLFATQRIWRNSGEWDLGPSDKDFIKKIINAIKDQVKENEARLPSIVDQAIEYAAYTHRDQNRKGTNIPYISHPYAVGMILKKAGCSEEVVTAGILHDTLEDTDTTERDLLERFGPVVLEIVKGCSEPDKRASWEERKQHTLDELKHAKLSIRQVSCADKLHNIRSIQKDLKVQGEEAWKRFKRGRESQEWYYKGIIESLGYSSRFDLLDDLQDVVEEVFGPSLLNAEWKRLRRSRKFIDLAFETAYGNPESIKDRELQFKRLGAYELMGKLHKQAYSVELINSEDFDTMAEYLQMRGIEFEWNSEGPAMLIGFSTALKQLLNMYPSEVYLHFKRNLDRRIL